MAPVKAPRSEPSRMLSIKFCGIAPQLRAINGPLARLLLEWSVLAATSLPLPDSPRIRTGTSAFAAIDKRFLCFDIKALFWFKIEKNGFSVFFFLKRLKMIFLTQEITIFTNRWIFLQIERKTQNQVAG
jgi:hypothetical protein